MKKVLLMMVLPVCLVMGQDQPELPGWGVYVGYGMMSASGDSVDMEGSGTVNTVSALGFGISKGVWLGGMPLQVGIGLHPRGYKVEASFEDESVSIELNAQYLDLWANMPYPVGPAFLTVGVHAGTFVSGKSKFEAEFYGITISDEEDLASSALGLDFGVNVGLGMPIGDTGAQVGVLYVLGLAEPSDGTKFNGLFFNAGYSF